MTVPLNYGNTYNDVPFDVPNDYLTISFCHYGTL